MSRMRHISEEEMFRQVDGECSLEEQIRFQAHLQQCRTCQAVYRELSALDGQLRQLMLEVPSNDFTEKLMEKWQGTPALDQSTVFMRSYSRIMAGFAFAFGLLLPLLWVASLDWATITFLYSLQESSTSYAFSSPKSWLQNELLLIASMIIMAVLVLLVIDKGLLQPYFRKKINQSGSV